MTAQTRFHLQDVVGADAQLAGDRVHFLVVQPAQPLLGAAQLEKQLALRLGGGHLDDAPVAQDEFVDFRPNPMHGKRHQPHAVRRIETLDRFHQANVAFLDQIAQRQAVTQIAARDMHHKAQVRHDQALRRFQVVAQLQTPSQILFFLGA